LSGEENANQENHQDSQNASKPLHLALAHARFALA
jgi:hypothetical protein